MRGEVCVGIATFLSFVSVMLLIFAHVGQINTSGVPRKLDMVHVNVSAYGYALSTATGVAVPGLYTTNGSAPLAQNLGLREYYAWGLYGYCGYVNGNNQTGGLCNSTFAEKWTPMDVILSDTPEAYNIQTRTLVPNGTAFKNSSYLAGLTKPAFWLLFIGTICAGLALLVGIVKNRYTFLAASFFSIVGTLFLLIGASIWTSAIGKSQTINGVTLSRTGVPIGIYVKPGQSLWLFWAAFVLLGLSTIPYTISCLTFLKR